MISKRPPEKKPPPSRTVQFVQVPRDVAGQYGAMRWADIMYAADRQLDGLRAMPADYFGLPAAAPGTCWLREGPTGGALLYYQNWRDETNDRRWRRHRPLL